MQSLPQLMPAGADVTVPAPVPALVTDSANGASAKSAVTVVAAVTVTVHEPVPVQPPPLQPLKIEPPAGAADSVTIAPWVMVSVQSAPQLMPAGDEVTVPAPVPVLVTVSVYVLAVNVAVIAAAAVTVSVQVLVPVQPPPLQPVNVEPAAGAAVSVIIVPWPTFSAQSAPQLMPAGDEVTVPLPVPALVTVTA